MTLVQTNRPLSQFLNMSSILFNIQFFQTCLKTIILGRSFHYYNSVGSTQTIAKSLENKINGTIILSEYQSAGKGRIEGRVWKQSIGKNLSFTLIIQPLNISDLNKFNLASSIAIANAIKQLCPKLEPRLKWPNDVYLNNKKVSGMLIDCDLSNQLTQYIGIGINVNEDMSQLNDREIANQAISISQACGNQVSREQLLSYVLNEMEILFCLNYNEILQLYKEMDLLSGKDIVVMPKKREQIESYYNAYCVGVNEEGNLLVKLENGKIRVLISEEVSVRQV